MNLAESLSIQTGDKLRAAHITGSVDEQCEHHGVGHWISSYSHLAYYYSCKESSGYSSILKLSDFDIADEVPQRDRHEYGRHGCNLKQVM